jgi:hypothetical protein
VRLEGLGQLKKSTSSGLEQATFWLVTQCLNQLRYCVAQTDQEHLISNVNLVIIYEHHLVPFHIITPKLTINQALKLSKQ